MSRSSRDLALRTHPLVFGVVLFLASELMFFGGMLAAYYNLRTLGTVWPPAGVHLDFVESAIGTGILGISSFSMMMTTHNLARSRYTAARAWLLATIVFGIVFLGIALHGYANDTFRIDTNAYGSVFYMMTGFHALHVAAGILLMLGLFAGIRMPAFTRDERAGAEAIGFYWHFVFGVWVLIWGSIYVVR